MKHAAILGSLLSLFVLLTLPLLHLGGLASAWVGQFGITAGTVGWFVCAPFWLAVARRPNVEGEAQ